MKRIIKLFLISLTIITTPRVLAETNPLLTLFEAVRVGSRISDIKEATENYRRAGHDFDELFGPTFHGSGKIFLSCKWAAPNMTFLGGARYVPYASLWIELDKRWPIEKDRFIPFNFFNPEFERFVNSNKIKKITYSYWYLDYHRETSKD